MKSSYVLKLRTALSGAILLAPAIAATTAHAQDTYPRSDIVVTGRGLADTPAAPAYRTSELDRDVLTSGASGRIEDVLANVAGFQQFRRSDSRSANPSAQGVTLRSIGGNATSRALVLLDGVPMADPFFGYIPLSAMAPGRLEHVRITHGGGSGAFGAGAVSGTIELSSAGPDILDPFNGSVLANSRGDTELSAIAAPRLGSGFAVISAQWDKGDGFYTTPQSQRVPQSARASFNSWSTSLRGVAPLNETTELQFGALLFDDHRTLRFKGGDSTSTGQDMSVRLVSRGDWQIDALAYLQARDFSNVVISATQFTPVLDQRDTPSTGYGGKLELRPPLGEHHVLRFGADWRVADGHMIEDAYNAVSGLRTATRRAGGQTTDLGLFAENDWRMGNFVLTAGARADRWTIRKGFFTEKNGAGAITTDQNFANQAGWEGSFRAGALWRSDSGFGLRAAAYTSLRQPTLNELYRPFSVFPVVTQANAALRNEKLEGFEAGIDYHHGDNYALSITAFDNRLKHAIANVTIGQNLRQRRNIDAIHARGIELTTQAQWGTLSFNGSLALTDSEMRGSGASAVLNGLRPSQVPSIAASGSLIWQPQEGWRISATVRHTGKQYEDDLQTDVLPAITTLDAFAEMPISPRFSLILRGENLTDTRIITRNQSGSLDLGVPATVWAGIKLRLGQ